MEVFSFFKKKIVCLIALPSSRIEFLTERIDRKKASSGVLFYFPIKVIDSFMVNEFN